MAKKQNIRQSISNDHLDQLALQEDFAAIDLASGKPTNSTELDNLMRSINSELTDPLRLSANSPANKNVNIGSATVTNPETGKHRVISTDEEDILNYTGGLVQFPADNLGNIIPTSGDPIPVTTPVSNYNTLGIYMDKRGDVSLVEGNPDPIRANLLPPGAKDSQIYIGYVVFYVDGAGNISDISSSDVYQFSSSGSGSGSGGLALQFIDHTSVPAELQRNVEYVCDFSGALSDILMTFPEGAADETYRIAVNLNKVSDTYSVGVITTNSQQIVGNTFTDVDITGIDSAQKMDFAFDGTAYRYGDDWFPTYTSLAGTIPVGSVIAILDNYTGVTVPASGEINEYGFQLCDGAALHANAVISGAATPDLTDGRFLRGSTVSGTIDGSATKSLLEANLPSHDHVMTHGHADNFSTDNDSHSHTRGTMEITGSLGGAGVHNPAGGVFSSASGAFSVTDFDAEGADGYTFGTNYKTANFKASDSWNGSTTSDSHNHIVTGSVTNFTGNTGNAGSGTSFNIEPAYLNVKYLIRVR